MLTHLSHLPKTKLFLEQQVVSYICPSRPIRSVSLARHREPIAFELDTVHAKLLEIERVPLVPTGKILVVHESNDY